MSEASVRRHFDRSATGYKSFRGTWPLNVLRQEEQEALRGVVGLRPGDRVLDAGCGDGETLAWLAACGADAVGIDLSPRMAAECRRRGFTVCVQDMERPAFRPCFDWVLCVGALEFVEDPRRTVASLAACLKPGGGFALLFPRRGWLGSLYSLYHRAHGVRISLFSHGEMDAVLAAAGLCRQGAWRDGWLSSVVQAERQ